ncbi:MAG TPA: BON domain-containing protein [Terriglobales bacterium]|jgi:osmotically-inducible protein OsmY
MKTLFRAVGSLLFVGILSAALAAQTVGAGRYDQDIQSRVAQELAKKKEFRNVQSAVEDGIVTLTGKVDLYQQKLDAAKKVRKTAHVEGVRNQIVVGTTVPDAELAAELDRKLYYDRIGYDNLFNYVTVDVKNGVATLAGETRTEVGRDSAVALVNRVPGVKEVVNNIKVSPVSTFDDDIRIRATRAIYGDSVLRRYGTDPALPIRIVVDRGKVTLFGMVDNAMDKQIAGMRANQVSGVFSVQNNLVVANQS